MGGDFSGCIPLVMPMVPLKLMEAYRSFVQEPLFRINFPNGALDVLIENRKARTGLPESKNCPVYLTIHAKPPVGEDKRSINTTAARAKDIPPSNELDAMSATVNKLKTPLCNTAEGENATIPPCGLEQATADHHELDDKDTTFTPDAPPSS
jgi:hypothetical protein